MFNKDESYRTGNVNMNGKVNLFKFPQKGPEDILADYLKSIQLLNRNLLDKFIEIEKRLEKAEKCLESSLEALKPHPKEDNQIEKK